MASSSSSVSEIARTGFAKGAAYDQHRPAYSASVVQVLLENLGVSGRKGAKILDLAAGTGKFTEALAARDEQYEVLAVEPVEKMRVVLADKHLPRVTVKEGRADSIPLEDESVDAVICAQAFHWFANMDALRDIHRVLKAHGSLGMVWNVDDYNGPQGQIPMTSWERKAHEILWSPEFDDNEPRYRHEKWRHIFDEQVKSTPLSLITASDDQLFSLPLAEHRESFEVRLSKEKVWERFNTLSMIAILEGEERERTYKNFMAALDSPDVEVDTNDAVAVHGETVVVWTSKIPAEGRESLIDVEKP